MSDTHMLRGRILHGNEMPASAISSWSILLQKFENAYENEYVLLSLRVAKSGSQVAAVFIAFPLSWINTRHMLAPATDARFPWFPT